MSGAVAARDEYRAMRYQRLLEAERVAAARLKQRSRLLEAQAVQAVNWIDPYLDLIDRYRRDPVAAAPATANDRRYGTNWPLWRTEVELSLLRQPARILAQTSLAAQGLTAGLTSYVVGTGFEYTCRARHEDEAEDLKPLLKACQEVVDREFLEPNQWHGGRDQPHLEAELFGRSVVDGEWFLVHWPDWETGRLEVRVAEPEQVTQPPTGTWEEWSFGVRTEPLDVVRRLGYWVYFGLVPSDGCEYGPDRVTHYRRNVPRTVKRGCPDYAFEMRDVAQALSELRQNLAEGAAEQAAIATVTQHDAATQDSVQTFRDADADYQTTDWLTGRQTNVRKLRKGTNLDVPKGQNFVSPPNAQNGPNHLAILSEIYRALGRRYNAPEWLTSGDASNNNYASSLVAESPFVKGVVFTQQGLGNALVESPRAALAHWCRRWGGIWVRTKTGAVKVPWEEVRRRVEVHAVAQSPEVRDRLQEAQRNQLEILSGYQSPQNAAQEAGRDWDKVKQEREEFAGETGGPGRPLPLPGDPGERTPPQLPAGAKE